MPIYLDHAASTPLDPEVFEYMHSFFLGYTGNPLQPMPLGENNVT